MRMLISLPGLAACDSPSARFIGAERTEVQRRAFTYVVYATEDAAEVIRLGYATPAQRGTALSDMAGLMNEVTGCKVLAGSIRGDSAALRARLRCPD
jgi:hypothetical protein